jgi:GNAT superfamily N-acetyltransferase
MIEKVRSERTNSDHKDFVDLIALLDKSLWEKYPEKGMDYWINNVIELNNNVIVIYLEEKPVACGCFKKYDENTIEIKRMFVDVAARGVGLAKKILNELELWAVDKGYTNAILETLFNQKEAIGLYQRVGYTIIDNYKPYTNSKNSICMKKKLMPASK